MTDEAKRLLDIQAKIDWNKKQIEELEFEAVELTQYIDSLEDAKEFFGFN